MVITKLIGGLGNQMFQYATGFALAKHHKTELKVDTSFLELDPKGEYTQRKFELGVFNTGIKRVEKEELHAFLHAYYGRTSRFLSKSLPIVFRKHYILEKGHVYDPDIFKSSRNVFISGFWQNEKYFTKYADELRKEFSLKAEYLQGTEKWVTLIGNSHSVSLHVRRGDYVSNKSSNDFHGTCSPEYYAAALNEIEEKHGKVEVFIFSDDLDWCKKNLRPEQAHHFVESASAYQDLYLMQHCRHNIIANSSFSWWGAWLNANAEKMVVAPKRWFSDEGVKTEVVPEHWIQI